MEHINFILYGVNDSNLGICMYIEDGEDSKFQELWIFYGKIDFVMQSDNIWSFKIAQILHFLQCLKSSLQMKERYFA